MGAITPEEMTHGSQLSLPPTRCRTHTDTDTHTHGQRCPVPRPSTIETTSPAPVRTAPTHRLLRPITRYEVLAVPCLEPTPRSSASQYLIPLSSNRLYYTRPLLCPAHSNLLPVATLYSPTLALSFSLYYTYTPCNFTPTLSLLPLLNPHLNKPHPPPMPHPAGHGRRARNIGISKCMYCIIVSDIRDEYVCKTRRGR